MSRSVCPLRTLTLVPRRVWRTKLCQRGQYQATVAPLPSRRTQHRILIDRPLQVVCQEKLTQSLAITDKVSNSSAKRRVPHQISPPYSSSVLASPQFPSRPRISTHHSEGLLMEKKCRRTPENKPNRVDVCLLLCNISQ